MRSKFAIAVSMAALLGALPAAAMVPPDNEAPECAACRGRCVVSETWVHTPAYIVNAERGDVLLYKGPGITSMLMIGFVWTHAGVMLDQSTVRHTTMDTDQGFTSFDVDSVLETLLSGPYGRVRLHEWDIYDGLPGSTDSDVDRAKAFGFDEKASGKPWRGMLALLKPASSGGRIDAQTATDWLQRTAYKYRVHAFYNTDEADESRGNACSGAIASATRKTTMANTGPVVDPVIPSALVSLAVLNLRQALYDHFVRPKVPKELELFINWDGFDAAAWSVTDQVLNCFIYAQGEATGCSKIDPQYVFQARRALGLHNGSSIYGQWDSGLPLLPPAIATAPDHLALSGGRTDLSTQSPESLATQSSLPRSADDLHWSVADTPSVESYLPRVANWQGANAGPWNGGALVTPQFQDGGWVQSKSYSCAP